MTLPPLSFEFILFCVVAIKLLIISFCVILARNPIHSVFFLIVAFLDASIIFLLSNAEFLAFVLAIVYVGAIAILFLFVVMMFDTTFDSIKERFQNFGFLALGFACFFATELGAIMWSWSSYRKAKDIVAHTITQHATNTEALGHILYTDYFYAFQLAGLILLLAMIGAIVLTLKTRVRIKRQNLQSQLERSPRNTLKMVNPKSHEGLQQGVKK